MCKKKWTPRALSLLQWLGKIQQEIFFDSMYYFMLTPGWNLGASQVQFWSLGWEDSSGAGRGNPSQHLAWRIPCTEEPGRLQSAGLQGVGNSWRDFVVGNLLSEIWMVLFQACMHYLDELWNSGEARCYINHI